MSALQIILAWLDGKKTYIFGAISLTVAYFGLQGYLDQNTQSYLQALIALFAGGAEAVTVKMGIREK
jgi:cytochrome c oxidase subunit IV